MEQAKKVVDITSMYHPGNPEADIQFTYAELEKTIGTFENGPSEKELRKKLKKGIKGIKRGMGFLQIKDSLDEELTVLYNRTTVISRLVSRLETDRDKLYSHLETLGFDIGRVDESYRQKRVELFTDGEQKKTLQDIEALSKVRAGRKHSIGICKLYIKATSDWIDFGKQAYQEIKEKTRDLSFYINIHASQIETVEKLIEHVTGAYSLLDGYFKNLVQYSKDYFSTLSDAKVLSRETEGSLEIKLSQMSTTYKGTGKETMERLNQVMGGISAN